MRPALATFRSRVARSIFSLFVLCVLVPIVALAVVSFVQVTREVRGQREERLRELSKAQVMGFLERVSFLSLELRVLGEGLESRHGSATQPEDLAPAWLLQQRQLSDFESILLVGSDGSVRALYGPRRTPPSLTTQVGSEVARDKAILSFDRTRSQDPGGEARVWLGREAPFTESGEILWGVVDPAYLWWGPARESTLPAQTELSVLAADGTVLFSSMRGIGNRPQDLLAAKEEAARAENGKALGSFTWKHEGGDYHAHYRAVPLALAYASPLSSPTVDFVLSEEVASDESWTEWLSQFRVTFPLILVLTLSVVLLLSIRQLRRRLVPLEQLREGTLRIAAQDFSSRVLVRSGDEFEELADALNSMSRQLGKQFHALSTTNEIVQAVLSSLNRQGIVHAVLNHLSSVIPAEHVAVTLLDETGSQGQTTLRDTEGGFTTVDVAITVSDRRQIKSPAGSTWLDLSASELPGYLAPFAAYELRRLVLVPIQQQRTLGVIGLGFSTTSAPENEDVDQVRHVADQVALALSNVLLIEELEEQNWGTLAALGRAIDAKSPWTMGHSERVTELALDLGRKMGLGEDDLKILHRGGLLHDIGKIGIPASILDSPNRLNEEEMNVVREHVRIGVRILEPIPGFADVLPLVGEHHEWYNGKGYPKGKSGESISLHARIFAVADCYDALRSGRPYRPAEDPQTIASFFARQSGEQFDPRVVEALQELLAERASEDVRAAGVGPAPVA